MFEGDANSPSSGAGVSTTCAVDPRQTVLDVMRLYLGASQTLLLSNLAVSVGLVGKGVSRIQAHESGVTFTLGQRQANST